MKNPALLAMFIALLALTSAPAKDEEKKASSERVGKLEAKVNELQITVAQLIVKEAANETTDAKTQGSVSKVRDEARDTAEYMHFIILLASMFTFVVSVFGVRFLDTWKGKRNTISN
jgi:hypothetical protein